MYGSLRAPRCLGPESFAWGAMTESSRFNAAAQTGQTPAGAAQLPLADLVEAFEQQHPQLDRATSTLPGEVTTADSSQGLEEEDRAGLGDVWNRLL